MVALLTPAASAISSSGVLSPRPWKAAIAAARIWATLRAASARSGAVASVLTRPPYQLDPVVNLTLGSGYDQVDRCPRGGTGPGPGRRPPLRPGGLRRRGRG